MSFMMDTFDIRSNVLIVFGLFLLFGVLGGIMANRIRWMPTITAFMLLGLLIGPHGLGLITKEVLSEAMVLIDIALGLILYKLGNMLHPKAMLRSKRLLLTSLAETILTFLCVFTLMAVLGYGGVLAALTAAIAVSSSPAVLVHVSDELRAKGPVTERAKSLVAMNNLFSFLIFSVVLPFALVSGQKGFGVIVLLPLYRLAVAAAIGVGVGWLAVRIARLLREEDEHYRFAIIIGAVMMTLGLSSMVAASILLSPLVLGLATRWFETSRNNLSRVGLGEGGDLFFIVLFVTAGAKLDPSLLLTAGVAPLLLVLMRSLSKFVGVFAVSKYTGQQQPVATALLLVPMAGMAIGLVATTATLVPEMGGPLSAMILAMVAVFETIGPFAASKALHMAGEVGKVRDALDVDPDDERVIA